MQKNFGMYENQNIVVQSRIENFHWPVMAAELRKGYPTLDEMTLP